MEYKAVVGGTGRRNCRNAGRKDGNVKFTLVAIKIKKGETKSKG